MYYYTILLLFCNIHLHDLASVVFNEINVDDPSKPEKSEFIELVAYGKKRPLEGETTLLEDYSLRGYKILGISAYQKGVKGPTIELIANLWNCKIQNSFFVFGGVGVENADLKVNSKFVAFRQKCTRTPSLYSFLNNANVYPHAIALVSKPDGLPDIKLTDKSPYISLTPDIKKLISDNLKDIVVYGRRANAEKCDIFEELHTNFVNTQYILREFDVPTDIINDYSLNRCTSETASFMPEKFKLGRRTPKAENDCSGEKFLLEKNIRLLTSPVLTQYRYDPIQSVEEELPDEKVTCSSSINREDYFNLESRKVHQYIQTMIDLAKMNDLCKTAAEGNLNNEGESESVVATADRAMEIMGASLPEHEWVTTKYFQNTWINFITKHQSKLLPVKSIENNKVWFEYLPNSEIPSASTYRCRLCSKYFDKFKLDNRYKPALANPLGIMKKNYDSNREMIVSHAKHTQHLAIISKLEKGAASTLPKQFEQIQTENEKLDKQYYAVTMKMIRSVFAEIKINLPFSAHSKIVRLQESNGVYLGYHHYERTSATRMTNLISSEMHKTLIQHLTDKHLPFSVIIDSSTDVSQRHYLIVYFQALEQNGPVVYFYKLIALQSDESARGLLTALTTEWEKDNNFIIHVKKNLRGFASDGAPVMLGKHNGLKKLLDDWTGRKLYGVHCMAHRLHLAIRSSLKDIPYFSIFEDNINEIHNFYNRHGHKRKSHLRQLAETLNIKLYEFSYIFRARWIASEFQALTNVNQSWYLLVNDLESISDDNSFSDTTRSKAKGLSQKLTNKNFLPILQFLCDVLLIFTHWSKRLQQRSGILVGAEEYQKQILLSFNEMKSKDGSFLTYFLANVVCSEIQTAGECSLDNYYASESIHWQNVKLGSGGRVPTLNSIREPFLSSIINEINGYFPNGDLAYFNVFMTEKLPQNEGQLILYGQREIQALATTFDLDPVATVSEWHDLLLTIINTPEFCRFQKTEATTFWQHYLNKDADGSLSMGKLIRALIQIILTLPISSADAERGFSIMNHMRTSRRARLEGTSLDALMRIRINGPDVIEQFKAAKYAKSWIKEHLRTDDPAQQRKKHKNELTLDDTHDSSLVYLAKSALF